MSATKGSSETLHTDAELQKHDLILWRFGAEGSLIAKADTEDNQTLYYDGDDGRFKGRLEMDSKTGSLTITDLETEHTGEFRLKIISDRRILFKRFTVTVSGESLYSFSTTLVSTNNLHIQLITVCLYYYSTRSVSRCCSRNMYWCSAGRCSSCSSWCYDLLSKRSLQIKKSNV